MSVVVNYSELAVPDSFQTSKTWNRRAVTTFYPHINAALILVGYFKKTQEEKLPCNMDYAIIFQLVPHFSIHSMHNIVPLITQGKQRKRREIL